MRALVVATDAPTVQGPPQGHWRYSDWEALAADGNAYEIIDGVLYMTTAPRTFHQWIQQRLYRFLGIPAEDRNLGYAFTAPVGLLMPGCDPVQPDFVFVSTAKVGLLTAGRIRGVPDLIIEILSPHNVIYDTQIKLMAYAKAGVPEYAIVDPRSRSLDHFRLAELGRYEGPQCFGAADTVRFACLPSIALSVGDLFAGAPDTSL